MRLWSLHPRYLDRRGLVALWREALLAQNVLAGATRGYRHHPQLVRFLRAADPCAAIATYLHGVLSEAENRGYRFDRRKPRSAPDGSRLLVSRAQLQYEWQHLQAKLRTRCPATLAAWSGVPEPDAHPMFRITRGGVAAWERSRPRT